METICIPDHEYLERIQKAAALLGEAELDVLVANSSEADYANVRYFTAYWPLFEMGGVAIAPSGEAALLIGPESKEYAQGRSKIPNIHRMTEYRETADPAYPDVPVSTYRDAFASIGVTNPKRIGIAGYLCTNLAMYEGLKDACPQAEIVNADDIMTALRSIKSPSELSCLREGLRLGELALEAMLQVVKPGMTELELAGIAVEALYQNGAEGESLSTYAFGGKKTTNAISRCTHRRLKKGEMIQINVGGRVDGYSPAIGRPICLGKMNDEQKRLVEFGKEMHYKTYEWVQRGEIACNVAKTYEEYVHRAGMKEYYLYGPCHGLGMIEVEKPWMESNSEYLLQPNMTFQADTFFRGKEFGLRWENGLRVTESGPAEMLHPAAHMECMEITC